MERPALVCSSVRILRSIGSIGALQGHKKESVIRAISENNHLFAMAVSMV